MLVKFFNVVVPLVFKPFLTKAEGLENIPASGAVVVANHASYLDHFAVGIPIRRKLYRRIVFLAKKEHFETRWGRFWHEIMDAIPLDRDTGGKEAMKKAAELLRNGDLVMIYPEGTRTLTGELNKGKPGAAKLALTAKVPIVPVGLHNTFKVWPKKNKLPHPVAKGKMVVGKPIYLDEYFGRENDKEALAEITDNLMREIAELAGKEYKY